MRSTAIATVLLAATATTANAQQASTTKLHRAFYGALGLADDLGAFGGYKGKRVGGQIGFTNEEFSDVKDEPIPGGIDVADTVHGWSPNGGFGVDVLGWLNAGSRVDIGLGGGVWFLDEAFVVEDGLAGTGYWSQDSRSETEFAGIAQILVGLGKKKKGSLLVGYHTVAGAIVGGGWRF